MASSVPSAWDELADFIESPEFLTWPSGDQVLFLKLMSKAFAWRHPGSPVVTEMDVLIARWEALDREEEASWTRLHLS